MKSNFFIISEVAIIQVVYSENQRMPIKLIKVSVIKPEVRIMLSHCREIWSFYFISTRFFQEIEEDKKISAATLNTVEGKETTIIVVSVLGSLLVLAVIGLSIGLGVMVNKYNKAKKPENPQSDSNETQEQVRSKKMI